MEENANHQPEMDEVETNPEFHPSNNSEAKEVDESSLEEAIDIQEANNMELQKSATEGECEDQGKEEESTATENKAGPENEPEQITNVIEAPTENPLPIAKIDAKIEENANHQSEMVGVEKNPEFQSNNNLEAKEVGKSSTEEVIDIKEATNMQLHKSATQSECEDQGKEEESTATENKAGPKNEPEQITNVIEAPTENPLPIAKIDPKMEENAHHQPEMDEVEKNPELHPSNNSETKEVGKSSTEEAIDIKEATNIELQKSATEGECEDQDKEEESTATENKAGQENEPEQITNVIEAPTENLLPIAKIDAKMEENAHHQPEMDEVDKNLEFHQRNNSETKEVGKSSSIDIKEATNMELPKSAKESECEDQGKEEESIATENKARPQNEPEQITIVIEAAAKNPLPIAKIDAELEENANHQPEMDEVEKNPEFHPSNNSKTKEVDNSSTEEATDMKEATNIELQKSATESEWEDQHKEEESTAAENNVGAENEPEQIINVIEAATENPLLIAKIDAEMEENANHLPKMDELEKNLEFHPSNNSETKDIGRSLTEEPIDIKEATNMELQKSATESECEDQGKEEESTITKTKAGPENEPEHITNVIEIRQKQSEKEFGLHEVTCQTRAPNELKDEPQSKEQNQDTIFTKHSDFEGEKTVTTYDIEEHKKVLMSQNREKLGVNNDENVLEEEEKEMEETTKMMSLKIATESMDNVDKLAVTDNNQWCRQESDLQNMANVEATDETIMVDKVCEENEEHAEFQSEASNMQEVSCQTSIENEIKNQERTLLKHLNLEGETTEVNPTTDTEDQEKLPASQSIEKLEIQKDGKFIHEAKRTEEATKTHLLYTATESVLEDKLQKTLPDAASVSNKAVDETSQGEIHPEMVLAVTFNKEEKILDNDFIMENDILEEHDQLETQANINELKEEQANHQPESSIQSTIKKYINIDGIVTLKRSTRSSHAMEEQEKIVHLDTIENLKSKGGSQVTEEEETHMKQMIDEEIKKPETGGVPEDDSQAALIISNIAKGDKFERIFQEQTHKKEESTAIDNNRCRPDSELEPNSTKSGYDMEEQERFLEPNSINNPENTDGGEIILEEDTNIKEVTNIQLQKSELESVPEDKAITTLSTISCVRAKIVEDSIQEEIQKEAESTVTNTNKKQRQRYEFVENMRVLEAFDLHEATSNTNTETEKNAEAQSQAQSHETTIMKHTSLGLETAEISPTNTDEIEEKHKITKTIGVCESISADSTKECSTEDIPKQEDLSMLSDQNTNNSIFDMSKISTHDYCKLDSEKEEKLFIPVSACTATNAHGNSEDTEGQEKTETDFDDRLICSATERVTIELGKPDCSDNHETADSTLAEKTVQAVDANEKLELAPGSLVKVESDRKNCFDTVISTTDTSIANENDESVRNNLESDNIITQEVAAELDVDGQRNIQESTERTNSELPVEKILEPPYPNKKVGSYFDSEAQNQTNEQPYQTKEESTNIEDQISEFVDHTQGEKFQSENQTKTETQIEGEHSSSIPLDPKTTSAASLIIKEVHGEVDRAEESGSIENKTIDSEKSSSEVQILLPREDTVNQVKHHNEQKLKGTNSYEEDVITEPSFKNELIVEEAESRDLDEAEFSVISRDSGDANIKTSHKKSHGILSGVGSKVKHSISKVKKAITGKSSHPKTPSPK